MALKTFAATTTTAGLPAFSLLASQPASVAGNAPKAADGQDAFSVGVIGDIPYGEQEIAKFPARIQDLNADRSLDFVAHDTFELPLVFTPGDNEVRFAASGNSAGGPVLSWEKIAFAQ